MWASRCRFAVQTYSRLQVDHCLMDGIKFEFNDIAVTVCQCGYFIFYLYCYYLLDIINTVTSKLN